jgi:hypothetical protein
VDQLVLVIGWIFFFLGAVLAIIGGLFLSTSAASWLLAKILLHMNLYKDIVEFIVKKHRRK